MYGSRWRETSVVFVANKISWDLDKKEKMNGFINLLSWKRIYMTVLLHAPDRTAFFEEDRAINVRRIYSEKEEIQG